MVFVRDLCSLQVHIEFTEGEDKITLEGPTKDVQIVQSQIEAIVTDLVGTGITFLFIYFAKGQMKCINAFNVFVLVG